MSKKAIVGYRGAALATPRAPQRRARLRIQAAALRVAYDDLVAAGVAGLHYVLCEGLLGNDGQGAVDGAHPTDLGFYRFAEALAPVLREILSGE